MIQGDQIKTSSSALNKGSCVVNNYHIQVVVNSSSSGDNGSSSNRTYHHDINNNDNNNNHENNRKRSFDETIIRNREVKTKIEIENRKPSKHQFTDLDEEAEF